MDLHYKQEITVGALVLVGVSLFVLGSMWLSGRELNPASNAVRVQFTDVGNLKKGNPVRISGVQLGKVHDIEFQEVGKVLVTLRMDRQIAPRLDAAARIASIGLVGDVVIDFNPGLAAEPLPADRVILGEQAEGLLSMGDELSGQAKVVLEGVSELANRRMADDLHQTLASIQRLADVFANRREGPTAELTASLDALRQLSLRLDSVLASPTLDRVVTDLDSVTSHLGRLTEQYSATGARLDSLLQRINRGEGTLGRLASDSTLFVELKDLTATVRAFVDTLRRHPGKITVQIRVF